jgi:hypothetical protein
MQNLNKLLNITRLKLALAVKYLSEEKIFLFNSMIKSFLRWQVGKLSYNSSQEGRCPVVHTPQIL